MGPPHNKPARRYQDEFDPLRRWPSPWLCLAGSQLLLLFSALAFLFSLSCCLSEASRFFSRNQNSFQGADKLVNVALPAKITKLKCVAARQLRQIVGQVLRFRHGCPLNQDWDHTDVTVERSNDFETDEIVWVVQPW